MPVDELRIDPPTEKRCLCGQKAIIGFGSLCRRCWERLDDLEWQEMKDSNQ